MGLEELGLDAQEEAVYRALVARPFVTAEELGGAGTRAVLEALVERGLASRETDGGERYAPAPPALALGAELAAHRARLGRAEAAVAELADAYRTGGLARAQRELVEVLEGRELIRRRFLQVRLAAEKSIDLLVTGGPRGTGVGEEARERTVAVRGVHTRGVVDRGFLNEPGAPERLAESLGGEGGGGGEVRFVEEIPLRLMICDDERAMLPLGGVGDEVDPCVVLRGGLVNVARALFEATWERARPYVEPHFEIGALDARILRLLLAGHTDAAVAGKLDLSARTVQRRIQALMRQAGVTTRIQLGWHARHQEWV
ncbi:LuxR family transcriptional regulator [Streptomyces albiaxialis]|uniref:LuxR family transcriptional regulator n=1 Tax=Streptomyces albiaxialis TaxID=329523 RepID=A0ABN2VEM5_9ACTN